MTIKEAVGKGMNFVTNKDEIAEFITTTRNNNDGTPDNYAYWFKIRPGSVMEALVPVDVNGACIDDEATTKMITVKKEKKIAFVNVYRRADGELLYAPHVYNTKEHGESDGTTYKITYIGTFPVEIEI